MRGWRLISARKHGWWCCKLQCFLWHNRCWSVKALDVVFIFPSIGWQRRQKARRIPSIRRLLETECLFFICTWRILSIGIITCQASAKEEMHTRSQQTARVRMVAYKLRQVVSRQRKISNLSMARKHSPHRWKWWVWSRLTWIWQKHEGSFQGKTWAVYVGSKQLRQRTK